MLVIVANCVVLFHWIFFILWFQHHPSFCHDPSPCVSLWAVIYFILSAWPITEWLRHFHFNFSLLSNVMLLFLLLFLLYLLLHHKCYGFERAFLLSSVFYLASLVTRVLRISETIFYLQTFFTLHFTTFLAQSAFIKASLEVGSSASKVAENSCRNNPYSIVSSASSLSARLQRFVIVGKVNTKF